MPRVTFVLANGERQTFEVEEGTTVKDCALANAVDGIVGECGGAMMCGTCHVYVDQQDIERAGPPKEVEEEILDVVAAERRSSSRLSCQLTVSSELDDLVVHVPETQV